MTKTYPPGSFKRTQNKLSIWFNSTTNSQRTHWVYSWEHCDQIDGHILKEISMSGSGSLWAHLEQICERTLKVFSKSGSWVHWWVLSEQIQNLPTDPIKIKMVGKFWKNSQLTWWVKCRQIVHKLSKNSQFACQVRPPLPPVRGRQVLYRPHIEEIWQGFEGWVEERH